MIRLPATQCRAEITFYHLDGHSAHGRTMAGRWADTPQPIFVPLMNQSGQVIGHIIDMSRLTLDSRIDIQPGESTLLDVAGRFDAEEDCYGWNNEAYFDPQHP